MEADNKDKRGGKREGAGRKTGINQTMMCVKVDNDLMPFVKAHGNKNRYINLLIREDLLNNIKDKDE